MPWHSQAKEEEEKEKMYWDNEMALNSTLSLSIHFSSIPVVYNVKSSKISPLLTRDRVVVDSKLFHTICWLMLAKCIWK